MENRTLVRHELFPRLPLPPWRVVLFCLAASAAVADGPPDAALLDALLKQPAPPPDWRIQLSSPELVKLITEQPADDVPVDALVEFWSDVDNQHCPSRKAQQRLLEACEADPENLPALLRWMPAGEPSISDRVKGLYDRLSQRSEQTIDLGLIHDWLMRHTDFFREDLLKATREALGASNGYGLEENAQALVHLDPAAARTLLGSFLQGDNDFARTASLVWLHRLDMNTNKSQAAQWRAELQKVASDSAASPRARDYSVAGLMQTPWDGQEKWFLGLFHDASLGGLHEGGNILTPLRVTVKQNPDRWIPKLVSLVGGADRAAHNNAVRCLTEYPQERALRPLLPWLSDPNWADVEKPARDRFINYLADVDLPESAPGLLEELKRAKGYTALYTATALYRYGVAYPREAARAGIEAEPNRGIREMQIRSAVLVGVFSPEEEARSVEDFLVKRATEEGRKQLDPLDQLMAKGKLDVPFLVGAAVAGRYFPLGARFFPGPGQPGRNRSPEDDLIDADLCALLRERRHELAATQPALAEELRTIIAAGRGPAAAADRAERFETGDFTIPWIEELINHRNAIADEIKAIDGLHGVALGLQIAIGGSGSSRLLSGNDLAGKTALLACARLARMPLPLSLVEPLLDSATPVLSRAAELYLEAEDSRPARQAVLRRHKGEALLIGSRWAFQPLPDAETVSGSEANLRKWVQGEDPAKEVFALLSEGVWGDAGNLVVAVYPNKIVFSELDGQDRRRQRVLSGDEFEKFRHWIEWNRIDELGQLDQGAMDGIQYEYVHLDPDGGRRVFMNNPPHSASTAAVFFPGGQRNEPSPLIYGRLVHQFTSLAAKPMEVVYRTLSTLPGFKIIHPRERSRVSALYFDCGRWIVAMTTPSGSESAYHLLTEDSVSPQTTPSPERIRLSGKLFGYPEYMLAGNVAGPCSGILANKYVWTEAVQRYGVEGILAGSESSPPELIVRGNFSGPVVTPDGKWIIVTHRDGESWAEPRSAVRIDVQARREIRVNLPAADHLDAIAWIPAHGKILLRRAKEEAAPGIKPNAGPDRPEFHLLDPATGELTAVNGEFRPLVEARERELQTSATEFIVWAALPSLDPEKRETVVGRYDLRNFKFSPILHVPGVNFGSSAMWVDEATRKVTFTVNGDLIRLSLP